MLALFVYWFDAYDIILSLVRPDTKNLIFGKILLTFSINWWGEEDLFPSSYGLIQHCQTIIKVLLIYSCSNKSFKRMGWGWYEEDKSPLPTQIFLQFRSFDMFLRNADPSLVLNTILLPSRDLCCHKSLHY